MLCIDPVPSPLSARKCGNTDCSGCINCVDMRTPTWDPPSPSLPPNASSSQHVPDGCIDSSVLSTSGGRLSSTTGMDDFVDGQFSNERSWDNVGMNPDYWLW
jgi:hypothetical protein